MLRLAWDMVNRKFSDPYMRMDGAVWGRVTIYFENKTVFFSFHIFIQLTRSNNNVYQSNRFDVGAKLNENKKKHKRQQASKWKVRNIHATCSFRWIRKSLAPSKLTKSYFVANWNFPILLTLHTFSYAII